MLVGARFWALSSLVFACSSQELPLLHDGSSGPSEDASVPPGPGGPRVSLVSFNILHGLNDEDPLDPFDGLGERLPLISKELARSRPDVILLQEVNVLDLPTYPKVIDELLEELNRQADGSPYRAFFGSTFGQPVTEAMGQGPG